MSRPMPFPLALGLSLGVVLLLFIVHLGLGSVSLPPDAVAAALRGAPQDPSHDQIVVNLRLPRGLIALVAGAMLGLAGAVLQATVRNPLAEPGLTGISPGAALGAVLWLTRGDMAAPGQTLPPVALLGGFGAGALVYWLSWRQRIDTARLMLTGVVVGALLSACTSFVLVLNQAYLGSTLLWLIGSLNGLVWIHWWTLWPWGLATLLCGVACAGFANVLQPGDDVALGLGARLEAVRALLLVVAAALTAGAVAIVGAIGFIGLVGPHIARCWVGQDARRLFPISALVAAGLLLGADCLAQMISVNPPFAANPQRAGIPVGAVTALLGAPVLLVLLRQRRRT